MVKWDSTAFCIILCSLDYGKVNCGFRTFYFAFFTFFTAEALKRPAVWFQRVLGSGQVKWLFENYLGIKCNFSNNEFFSFLPNSIVHLDANFFFLVFFFFTPDSPGALWTVGKSLRQSLQRCRLKESLRNVLKKSAREHPCAFDSECALKSVSPWLWRLGFSQCYRMPLLSSLWNLHLYLYLPSSYLSHSCSLCGFSLSLCICIFSMNKLTIPVCPFPAASMNQALVATSGYCKKS